MLSPVKRCRHVLLGKSTLEPQGHSVSTYEFTTGGGGCVRGEGTGGLRRGWRQDPAREQRAQEAFLWPPPSILPERMRRGAGVAHPGPAPTHPTSWFLRNIPPLPESFPLLWALRSAGPDLTGAPPHAGRCREVSPAPEDSPSVLFTGHQVQAGRRPACGEQESLPQSRKVTVRGEADAPAGHRALRPAAEEGETRRQACVAQGEVLMGKAGKKLPTAMETSRKTPGPCWEAKWTLHDAQLPRLRVDLQNWPKGTTINTKRSPTSRPR